MRNVREVFGIVALLLAVAACPFVLMGQNAVKEIERQKQEADRDIKEAKRELSINEKKVNENLISLRKIDEDIAVSQKEIETVKEQLTEINGNIEKLEESIAIGEEDLAGLRAEYLKAVKKMRLARKQNSALAFIFSSGSFNEARRRMRYMKEFSEWKERRSAEIKGKVADLQKQHEKLSQARNDAGVALGREQAAQTRLTHQKEMQQSTVNELRANSDVLREKIARRQAEARQLSNKISALIAEQRAKEEEARRKAAEEKRIAEEKRRAEERRMAEERRAAEEKRKAEEKAVAEKRKAEEKAATEKRTAEEKTVAEKKKTETPASGSSSTAESRKRNRTTPVEPSKPAVTEKTQEQSPEVAPPAGSGFEGMKGYLPRPVAGSFKIVSPFGTHPISPELPNITEENLGIDVHVANGAAVTSVYEGEVIKIYDRSTIPGYRNIVVVRHGDFTTVYANLETLAVKSGQKVKQGQTLGSVGSDFDEPSKGRLHFELWKNQSHLDPSAWIR